MSYDNRLSPSKWKSVTKSDTEFHNIVGFRVGTTAGDVTVEFADGTTHTFPNVQIGEQIPCTCVRIKNTGTNAAGFSGAVT